MRRTARFVLLLFLVALLIASVPAVALAAIHPISSSECADDSADGTAAETQNPPGQTPGDGPGDDHGDLQGPSNSIPNSDGESKNGNSGAENCPNA